MEDYIISMALTIVLSTIKNPGKKTTLKSAFLKVFKAIKSAYGNDPDFQ